MHILISMYLFILGASLGSFTLVMVDRMHAKKSWVKGRSQCDSCKKTLQPVDLIPIFSWLLAKGRCRHCGVKLSQSYPLVELGLGLAYVVSYAFWPYELSGVTSIATFVIWLCALVPLTALILFDIRWYLLPTKLIQPLVVLGIIWMSIDIFNGGFESSKLLGYVLALLVSAGFFYILHIVSDGKWIGDGDVRFGVVIGLFTGNPFYAWFCLFLASLLGLIISVPVLSKSKKKNKLKLKIPFGPVLITALFITVLFGTPLVDWYKETILLL